MRNKKGLTTIGIVALIFIAFLVVIGSIVVSFSAGKVDEVFSSVNVEIGNTTFNETYQSIMHNGVNSLKTTVPQIFSIGILLGMFALMILVGYNIKGLGKVWIVVDLLILIVAEFLAFIVSGTFENNLLSIGIFLEVARDTLPEAAKFILNLTKIVPVLGVVTIISTHILSKEKKSEDTLSEDIVPYY